MDPGRRFYWTGLLILFLICAATISAEESPLVSVTISIDTDSQFTMTFIIDYPAPDNVSIIEPSFPATVSIDRIVKYPRIFDTHIRTVVEYSFMVNNAGPVILESFIVRTPAGTTEAGPFFLQINAPQPQQRIITPRLGWEGIPNQMAAGERLTFTLRAFDWASPQPPPAFFLPEVPQGFIMSSQPLAAAERAGGIVMRLMLIPLAPGNFSLPARVLYFENTRFEIPALNIRVTERSQ
jgi:hypothetical protein